MQLIGFHFGIICYLQKRLIFRVFRLTYVVTYGKITQSRGNQYMQSLNNVTDLGILGVTHPCIFTS